MRRPVLLAGLLLVAGCARPSPSNVAPRLSYLAVVVERAAVAVSDSLVLAAAPHARIVPASALATLSAPMRWQRLAVEHPQVDAILTISPAIEPDRGSSWSDGSRDAVTIQRSWRRFSATLRGRETGGVLWSETFSNGPAVNGFLPTEDIGRATRLVFDELQRVGVLRADDR